MAGPWPWGRTLCNGCLGRPLRSGVGTLVGCSGALVMQSREEPGRYWGRQVWVEVTADAQLSAGKGPEVREGHTGEWGETVRGNMPCT